MWLKLELWAKGGAASLAAPRCRAVVLEAMASQEAMGCAPGRAALSYMLPGGLGALRQRLEWP